MQCCILMRRAPLNRWSARPNGIRRRSATQQKHFLRAYKGEADMSTQEIPRNEWKTFLDTFSHQHEGWLATLEVLGNEIGAQEEVHDLPLEGITASSRDGAPETIAISLGETSENHVTHTVT